MLPIERDARTSCRIPRARGARPPPRRSPAPSRTTCGSSRSSPTRSPRTRRSPTAGAASRMSRRHAISPTGSSRRWSTRWSPPCARPIRACRTATMRSKRNGSARSSLPHWDRNAPLPKVPTRTISWSEAEETVLDAYGAFSPRMAEIAERFFRDRWIDAPARPGKSPGAFSHPTVPSAHPYVLLNYLGKPRDVMTLAHELGHGVHQVLAAAQRGADGADAAHARRDRERVRRDAHLPQAARRDQGCKAAQGHARRQGRGHDQHGGAADRVLHVRARGPHRAAQRRAHRRSPGRDLAQGADREPRAGDRARSPATRASGPTSRTSSIRRSTSTPTRSATAW